MILTKLMYAAPIWLWNNIEIYKGMWQNAFMKITGAMLNPNQCLSELSLQLPPLEIMLEVQTVKFLCKVLTSEDNLTSTLLQVEGSPHNVFHRQLSSIKDYIHWRYPVKFGRTKSKVDLLQFLQLEQHGIDLQYTKEDILTYQVHKWKSRIINQLHVAGSTSTNDQVLKLIDDQNFQLERSKFLFNNKTTKREDSYLLDFIHGNSYLFGNCRKRMNFEDHRCYFCQEEDNGPTHQLFFCKEVQDTTHTQLTEVIKNPYDYIQEVLISDNKEVQQAFINRVKFLIGQHDFLDELDI